MVKGREGNVRCAVRVRLKADGARGKKSDGDDRRRSNVLEGSKPFFIDKFQKIFYTTRTRLDTRRTFAVSSLGSPLLPLQTPEDLEGGKMTEFMACV